MSFKFLRPGTQTAWENQDILERFARYKAILDGKVPARYLIAKTIECNFTAESSTKDLVKILNEKSLEFENLLDSELNELKERRKVECSYLSLVETLALRYLKDCIYCERKCHVNRIDGEKGYCLIPNETYISSAFLHYGEESVLIPSGTIFFQGCNFGCVFCQNAEISQTWKGKNEINEISRRIDSYSLANIAHRLEKKGAFNINYVGGDPIPNIHTIISSLKYQEMNICQLWNSNFFLTNESLSLIIDLMDFWLPDFKYGNNECAKKYSDVDNYYNIITRNLKRIHDEGSGEIIVRHLVMPNHIECCSKPILDYIHEETPNCVVNIMQQYRPEYKAYKFEEINRRPSHKEMQEVKDYAVHLGILYKPVS